MSYILLHMTICGIYQIKNTINNKKYIGQSKNIKKRWKEHQTLLKRNQHHNNHLQNAWNKYGENYFSFSIVEQCIEKELNSKEQYWIEVKNTYEQGYNLDKGGKGILGYKKGYYRVIKKGEDKEYKRRYQLINPDSTPVFTSILKEKLQEICSLLNNNDISEEQAITIMQTESFNYRKKILTTKHTNIDINSIIEQVKKGHRTKQDIMEIYSISVYILNSILKNNNITWQQIIDQANIENIKEYDNKYNIQKQIDLGKTTKQLCNEINCTYNSLKSYKKSNNIKKNFTCKISATNTGVRYVSLLSTGEYMYRRTHENPNNITRVNFMELKEEIEKRNLKWIIDDEIKYQQTKKQSVNDKMGRKDKSYSFKIIEDNNLIYDVVKGIKNKNTQSDIFTFLSKQYHIPYNHFIIFLLEKNISWDNLYYYAHISKIKEHEQEIILLFIRGCTQQNIAKKFNLNKKIFMSFCQENQYKTHIQKKNVSYNNQYRPKPNTTGYYRVDKQVGKRYKNGFTYRYSYNDDNGKVKTLKSTNIEKLEKKVKEKGLKWQKVPIKK